MTAAVLSGTVLEPVLSVSVPYAEADLRRALRNRPGCWWEDESKRWRITGPEPRSVCARLRIGVDESGAMFRIEDTTSPVVYPHPTDPTAVIINPRLAGADHVTRVVAPLRVADPVTGWVVADPLDLADRDGLPLAGLTFERGADQMVRDAWETRVARPRSWMAPDHDAVLLARSFDPDDPEVATALARMEAAHPVPEWFGLDLYPFQRIGTQAVLGGHRLVCDPMGLGKMRLSLSVIAGLGAERAVVLPPPNVATEFCVQACDAHLGAVLPKSGVSSWVKDADHPPVSPAANGARIVAFASGRKQPDLPETGVVVVTDSLLASRPELADRIADWSPQAIVYDEAHRARGASSKRSVAVRSLVHRATAQPGGCVVVPMTGTPTPSGSPTDLVPLLDMVGMLDPVYGGQGNFVRRYAHPKFFGGFEASKDPEAAARLASTLDLWTRVRRRKADVMPWLPPKSRVVVPVDPDMAAYRAGLVTVERIVAEWATEEHDATGAWPTESDVDGWARDHATLASTLRIASAMSKLGWLTDLVCGRLDEQQAMPGPCGQAVWEEPQIVWCWHKEVMSAVAASIAKRSHPSGEKYAPVVLDGSTSAQTRDAAVRGVQDGTVPVVVCQIQAMGVGVTMTRCHSPVFLETDWLPALNEQAEDRCHRPGQDEPVEVTIGWAPGTTDDHLFAAAAAKARSSAAISGDEAGKWPHPDVPVTGILTEVALRVVDREARRKSLP